MPLGGAGRAQPAAAVGGSTTTYVGILGFGNVGRDLAQRLRSGAIPGVDVSAVTSRDLGSARDFAASYAVPVEVLPLAGVVSASDILVECATAEALPALARIALSAGKNLVAVSACGLLDLPEVDKLARDSRSRFVLANGVFPGLDIIRCAREGTIRRVVLISRLKPESLDSEPYVQQHLPEFRAHMNEPVKVFEGNAARAASVFPRHFNVAVSLSLAGIGLEHTEVTVWSDPRVAGAEHTVELTADEISLTMTSRNVPSVNPRTSKAVVLSILAALRSLMAPVRIGS